jgi:hypothetical protein
MKTVTLGNMTITYDETEPKYVVVYCKNYRVGSFKFTTSEERDNILVELQKELVLHTQTAYDGSVYATAIGVKSKKARNQK